MLPRKRFAGTGLYLAIENIFGAYESLVHIVYILNYHYLF